MELSQKFDKICGWFIRWGDTNQPETWHKNYASSDRLYKYFFGSIRLFVFIYLMFDYFTLDVNMLILGVIGAIVNTQLFHQWLNILSLTSAGVYLLFQPHRSVYIHVLTKTMVGDFAAGKLDTIEWKTGIIYVLMAWFVVQVTPSIIFLLVLSLLQFIVEFLDGYMEHYTIFRHRYFFEGFYLLLLHFVTLSPYELSIIKADLVICLGYRVGNVLQILLF
jgi:hypothetical protein